MVGLVMEKSLPGVGIGTTPGRVTGAFGRGVAETPAGTGGADKIGRSSSNSEGFCISPDTMHPVYALRSLSESKTPESTFCLKSEQSCAQTGVAHVNITR